MQVVVDARSRAALAEARLEKTRTDYKELQAKFEALLARYTEYKGKYNVAVGNEKRWADKLSTLSEDERVRSMTK